MGLITANNIHLIVEHIRNRCVNQELFSDYEKVLIMVFQFDGHWPGLEKVLFASRFLGGYRMFSALRKIK